MTKRTLALTQARIAGYHNDNSTFTRLAIGSRIGRETLKAAWRDGVLAREAGVPCPCELCAADKRLAEGLAACVK